MNKARFKDIIVLDKNGAIYEGRDTNSNNLSPPVSNKAQYPIPKINPFKKEIALNSNKRKIKGDITTAIKEADVFIGTSGIGNLLDANMIKTMNKNPIIFALSYPTPEILPVEAVRAGAEIVGTGRSDFANQINDPRILPVVTKSVKGYIINRKSINP